MSKTDNYILVTWWWDDMGDYKPTFQTEFDFIPDSKLKDISKLMKEYGVKQWVKDPHTMTSEKYKPGDGSLIEYRNMLLQTVKVVESWSYKPEQVNS